MKVAIPSDDKIKISTNILTCKGYLIFELDEHSLVNYVFSPNPHLNDELVAESNLCNTLSDCSTVICGKINGTIKEKLKSANKQILTTFEENAKKALINLMCRV